MNDSCRIFEIKDKDVPALMTILGDYLESYFEIAEDTQKFIETKVMMELRQESLDVLKLIGGTDLYLKHERDQAMKLMKKHGLRQLLTWCVEIE